MTVGFKIQGENITLNRSDVFQSNKKKKEKKKEKGNTLPHLSSGETVPQCVTAHAHSVSPAP